MSKSDLLRRAKTKSLQRKGGPDDLNHQLFTYGNRPDPPARSYSIDQGLSDMYQPQHTVCSQVSMSQACK